MQDKFRTEYRNFKNTIEKLSLIEKMLAGMVFFVALLIPLPGTGPASIIMITAYAGYRIKSKK